LYFVLTMTDRDDFSELISVFLDGEVTPEERASIEERLVDNAADRRLFEEMRSIRDSLRSLPRRELGKDLSQSVLRSAERAMLSAEATELSQPHDQQKTGHKDLEGHEAAIVATPPSPPQRNNWRTLVWVGLTVAAAVLIMVIGNWPERQRPVAMLPTDEQPNEAAGEPTSSAEADRADDAVAEMANDAGASPPPAPANGVRESKLAHLGAVEEAAAGVTPERKASSDSHDFSAGVDESRLAAGGRGAEMPEDDSSVPDSLTRRYSETPKAKKPADDAADDLFAQSVTDELASIEIPPDRLLLVRLDVSPDAVRAHSLDDTLVRNSVSFEYVPGQLPGIREAFAAGQQRKRLGVDQVVSRRALRELEGRQEHLAMAGDGGIVVSAKAPAQQVRAALKDLLEQKDAFQIAGVHAVPPTGALQEIAKQLNGAEKAQPTAPSAPQGPDLPADADSSAVTDAEGEDAEGATAEKMGLARKTAPEPEPAGAPSEDAPAAAFDSGPPAPGEGFAGRVGGGVAAPQMPAEVQAEEALPPAGVPPVVQPLVEALEQPEPTEERVAESDGDDEAVVLPAESKPSEPDGVLRKPSEGSAKKDDLFQDVAEAERDEEKKLQHKAEEGSGLATRSSDMKRGGQDSDRQQAGGTDAARRKNRGDGRFSGDTSDSDKPREDGAQPRAESGAVKKEGERGTTSAVAATSPEQAGGFGGGMFGKSPLPSDAVSDGKGVAGTGQVGQKKLAEAPQSAPAPQMVRVLFVLRTVTLPAGITASPPGNIAADVPPGQPPTAAARMLHGEVDAAAEAAEGVIEPADPAVRD
jgi:hypothetical protein